MFKVRPNTGIAPDRRYAGSALSASRPSTPSSSSSENSQGTENQVDVMVRRHTAAHPRLPVAQGPVLTITRPLLDSDRIPGAAPSTVHDIEQTDAHYGYLAAMDETNLSSQANPIRDCALHTYITQLQSAHIDVSVHAHLSLARRDIFRYRLGTIHPNFFYARQNPPLAKNTEVSARIFTRLFEHGILTGTDERFFARPGHALVKQYLDANDIQQALANEPRLPGDTAPAFNEFAAICLNAVRDAQSFEYHELLVIYGFAIAHPHQLPLPERLLRLEQTADILRDRHGFEKALEKDWAPFWPPHPTANEIQTREQRVAQRREHVRAQISAYEEKEISLRAHHF